MPTIYFVVFDQAEVLDFSGPFDVFSMAMIATQSKPYDLRLVSADGAPISAIHGFRVMVDGALDDVEVGREDIVIFPGGGTDVIAAIAAGEAWLPDGFIKNSPLNDAQRTKLEKDCAAIVDWIKGPGQKAGLLATVCVGAFFGAKAGLFAGQKATTHHQFLNIFKEWTKAGGTHVMAGARYVMNHDTPEHVPLVMSSAGVSAGMDLSFDILGLVLGAEAQASTADLMEYNRTTNFDVTRPDWPSDLDYRGALPKKKAPEGASD